ncbi:hypothetical protein PMI13_01301 [Chryseobacterium populi]|uniref:Uncharacterized protein n=1 Tax=Chryseobacterium populi TaxID=1144316 RepID=J3CL94_9FLAO|nr:hypothetical protein PMI13_01301 [Chryseobacterium populi]
MIYYAKVSFLFLNTNKLYNLRSENYINLGKKNHS